MGWKGAGHGLGLHQQGITKPIEVDQIRQRSGIGCHPNYDEYLKEIEMETIAEENQLIHSTDLKSTTTTTTTTNNRRNNIPNSGKKSNVANIVVNGGGYNRYRKDFRSNIQSLLKNFIGSVTEEDLVFEKGLTSEERAMVHKEASRFGLKTRSQGNGENRFLVAQKKRTAGELMDTIVKNGGQFSKYELFSKGDMK